MEDISKHHDLLQIYFPEGCGCFTSNRVKRISYFKCFSMILKKLLGTGVSCFVKMSSTRISWRNYNIHSVTVSLYNLVLVKAKVWSLVTTKLIDFLGGGLSIHLVKIYQLLLSQEVKTSQHNYLIRFSLTISDGREPLIGNFRFFFLRF